MNFLERRRQELVKLHRTWRGFWAGFAQRRYASGLSLGLSGELVVFFVSTVHECNGGVMSIASLAAYTRRVLPGATVLTATLPGDPTLLHNDFFPNDETVLTLRILAGACRPQKLILHVPEMAADDFVSNLSGRERAWIESVPSVQINILNQNIDFMRPREAWADLFALTPNVTQTTAHARYTSQEMCDRYGVPLHRFGVYMDRSRWPKGAFAEKEKLIVISPDHNPDRARVLAAIARDLPDYRVREVNDLTFSAYLSLIARARFVVTFGEGFDGYFNQPPYANTVGIAVYNAAFFPNADWLALENVYRSYDDLAARFCADVRRWEGDARAYEDVVGRHLAKHRREIAFPETQYLDNLRRFYAGDFDFRPRGYAGFAKEKAC